MVTDVKNECTSFVFCELWLTLSHSKQIIRIWLMTNKQHQESVKLYLDDSVFSIYIYKLDKSVFINVLQISFFHAILYV